MTQTTLCGWKGCTQALRYEGHDGEGWCYYHGPKTLTTPLPLVSARPELAPIICEGCGAETTASTSTKRFCSRECSNKHLKRQHVAARGGWHEQPLVLERGTPAYVYEASSAPGRPRGS